MLGEAVVEVGEVGGHHVADGLAVDHEVAEKELGLGDHGDLRQRDAVTVDRLDEQVAERLGDRRARGHQQARLEPAVALVDPADRHADAGGLDREQGVLHVHAVAGEAGAVVARAGGLALEVFIPPDANARVVERLRALDTRSHRHAA